MRGLRYLLLVISLLLPMSSYCEVNNTKSEYTTVKGVVAFELIAIGYSLMLASEPEVMGALTLAISPFGETTTNNGESNYLGVGCLASLGLYNMVELGNGKYSDNEIARRNFIIFNSLILGTLINDAIFSDEGDDELSILPMENGLIMGFNHRF